MSMPSELPPVVRQGTSWKPSVILGFAAFVLTILAVQLWGQIRSQIKAGNIEPVTAIVEQCPPGLKGRAGAFAACQPSSHAAVCSKSVQQIKDQVTSPDLLRKAWDDAGYAAVDRNNHSSRTAVAEVEKLRRALRVDVEDSPLGGKCLRLALSWPNTQEAAKFLKILGERYATQYRAALTTAYQRECNEAKTASEQAGLAFDEAAAEFSFFEGYLAWQSAAAEDAIRNRPANSPLSTLDSPLTKEDTAGPLRDMSDVENPAWINQQKKLDDLRNKVAILLEKRTPQHPEVQYLQDQIHECQLQLVAIPQWIHAETFPRPTNLRSVPGEGPGVRADSPIASKNPSPTLNGASIADDTQLLAALESEVRSTAQAYREALAREWTVLGQRKVAPEITVRVWRPRKISIATPSSRPFSWLAGVMMAVGVGLICTGKAIEPPVGSVEELHRLTSVPIVGVVPSYTAIDPRAVKRQKSLLRFGLFLSGLILVSLCLWAVIRIL